MPADSNHRNRLANETSPYLLQHAANPVDWYPWGDEAFERAKAEDRPILLSVGYSSCHWCHVMAHESFENESTAATMNASFVNIKVDREERPDVDSVYMTATQALTGQGGWPMTVFLTPERKPFYAGTYYPPEDMHGRPGFPRLLASIRDAWDNNRANLLESADTITARLREATDRPPTGGQPIDAAMLADAAARFAAIHDTTWGGFGGAPKFPSPSNLEFLLAHGELAGDSRATEMALFTLRQMAAGGMYDQVGGGFSRYSVDERWLVPHFEKMLYDNAQLARTYLHAWQITKDPGFARVARETLDYLEREMRHTQGGFFSAQDADTEGIEGKYYVWTVAELRDALGDEADDAIEWFGVTAEGNFMDPHHPEFGRRNVLSFPRSREEIRAERGWEANEFDARINRIREKLREVRSSRVAPGLDDKVLTSWNGLALAAFAEAARVLGDERYRQTAEENARFVRDEMWVDGRLRHTWKDGVGRVDGLLEDYAYYGLGLVELYKLTGDLETLGWAAELLEAVLARFRDSEHGGFFEAPSDGEALLLRQKPFFDSATPGENSAVGQLAWWLGRYNGREDWEAVVDECAAQVAGHVVSAPNGFGALLLACEYRVAPPRELVIVGGATERAPLERVAGDAFLPGTLIVPAESGGGLPVLDGRGESGRVMAYVCEDMVCQLPVSTELELREQLAR